MLAKVLRPIAKSPEKDEREIISREGDKIKLVDFKLERRQVVGF